MKKTKKSRWMMIQLVLCFFLSIGTVFLLALMVDREKSSDTTPPVIKFLSDEVEYTLGDDTSILLNDVIAEDGTDGDVTASVRVRNISVSEGNTEAVVSYVAKDQANNIALIKRIVNVKVNEKETKAEANDETQESTENTDEVKSEEEKQ